jgi:hypothetical protein
MRRDNLFVLVSEEEGGHKKSLEMLLSQGFLSIISITYFSSGASESSVFSGVKSVSPPSIRALYQLINFLISVG